MGVKKIVIADNRTEPPIPLGDLTLDIDSNGRLKMRGPLPKGMSQDMADSVCSTIYIGVKTGSVGPFTWSQ